MPGTSTPRLTRRKRESVSRGAKSVTGRSITGACPEKGALIPPNSSPITINDDNGNS